MSLFGDGQKKVTTGFKAGENAGRKFVQDVTGPEDIVLAAIYGASVAVGFTYGATAEAVSVTRKGFADRSEARNSSSK